MAVFTEVSEEEAGALLRRLELGELAARLGQAGVESRQNGYLLRFAADAVEWTVFPDGRAIITGTEDESHARSLYARWIGM